MCKDNLERDRVLDDNNKEHGRRYLLPSSGLSSVLGLREEHALWQTRRFTTNTFVDAECTRSKYGCSDAPQRPAAQGTIGSFRYAIDQAVQADAPCRGGRAAHHETLEALVAPQDRDALPGSTAASESLGAETRHTHLRLHAGVRVG
jgi:hypothetical protein